MDGDERVYGEWFSEGKPDGGVYTILQRTI